MEEKLPISPKSPRSPKPESSAPRSPKAKSPEPRAKEDFTIQECYYDKSESHVKAALEFGDMTLLKSLTVNNNPKQRILANFGTGLAIQSRSQNMVLWTSEGVPKVFHIQPQIHNNRLYYITDHVMCYNEVGKTEDEKKKDRAEFPDRARAAINPPSHVQMIAPILVGTQLSTPEQAVLSNHLVRFVNLPTYFECLRFGVENVYACAGKEIPTHILIAFPNGAYYLSHFVDNVPNYEPDKAKIMAVLSANKEKRLAYHFAIPFFQQAAPANHPSVVEDLPS